MKPISYLPIRHIGMFTNLLSNHVDRVLDAAVGNDGNDGCVDNSEVVDSKDLELGVDDTLPDRLA